MFRLASVDHTVLGDYEQGPALVPYPSKVSTHPPAITGLTKALHRVYILVMPSPLFSPGDIWFTDFSEKPKVPEWAKPYRPRSLGWNEITHLTGSPRVAILESKNPRDLLQHYHARLSELNSLSHIFRPETVILLAFKKVIKEKPEFLAEVLRAFPARSRVEFALSPANAPSSLLEALAKNIAFREYVPEGEIRDPLEGVKKIVRASQDLRSSESGRLSAKQIAKIFNVSQSFLAEKLLGRTRQAVSQKSDAESLQEDLLPFEKVARLRAVLDDSDFKRWLRMPNSQLDEITPLKLILKGKIGVVSNLVQDMLTGKPA